MRNLTDADKDKVRRQMEFYFSDSNLPYDKYLRKQVEAAQDGWVDLSVLVVFSRMRALLKLDACTPEDVDSEIIEEVAACLRASEVIEVSEDSYTIRRRDMPEDLDKVMEAVDRRTVQAAPFPFNTTMDAAARAFRCWGTVRQVRLLRREAGVAFSGKVLVEMETQAEADAVLAAVVEHEGAVLRVQTKAAYMDALREVEAAGDPKVEDARDPKSKPANAKDAVAVERPLITSEGLPEDQPMATRPHGSDVAHSGDDKAADAREEAQEVVFTGGLLVRARPAVPGVGSWQHGKKLRELLGGREGGVNFVEIHLDEGYAIVRCETKEVAAALAEKGSVEQPLQVGDGDEKALLILEVIDGTEEKDFWAGHEQQKSQKRRRSGEIGVAPGGKRARGGRGARGRGQGRGRGRRD